MRLKMVYSFNTYLKYIKVKAMTCNSNFCTSDGGFGGFDPYFNHCKSDCGCDQDCNCEPAACEPNHGLHHPCHHGNGHYGRYYNYPYNPHSDGDPGNDYYGDGYPDTPSHYTPNNGHCAAHYQYPPFNPDASFESCNCYRDMADNVFKFQNNDGNDGAATVKTIARVPGCSDYLIMHWENSNTPVQGQAVAFTLNFVKVYRVRNTVRVFRHPEAEAMHRQQSRFTPPTRNLKKK